MRTGTAGTIGDLKSYWFDALIIAMIILGMVWQFQAWRVLHLMIVGAVLLSLVAERAALDARLHHAITFGLFMLVGSTYLIVVGHAIAGLVFAMIALHAFVSVALRARRPQA